MSFTRSLASLLLALVPQSALAQEDALEAASERENFQAIFDGETLRGWTNPFDWGEAWVEAGELRLRGERKFFLVSERSFGDFALELEVRLPEGTANSGIMFRCHSGKNSVFGYQAEVDPSARAWSGGLYDEGRRAWIAPLKGAQRAAQRAAFLPGGWNRYRIECQGDWIRIWVNDVLTTDVRDPLDQLGPIALQHHGEQGQTYRFRHIRVAERGRHEWRPLFDGESLAGWTPTPGGEWSVHEGAIVGRSPAAEARHGLLIHDALLDDFTVRFEFRSLRGNSGFYFRSTPLSGLLGVRGLQAELEPWIEGRPCRVGGLYETGGRGWVVKPPRALVERAYQPQEWNSMAVSAHGERVVVHLNGIQTAELTGAAGARAGRLALQLHGGEEMHVEFRGIERLTPVAR